MFKRSNYLMCFVVMMVLTVSIAAADITEGLVGHWPLIDGAGNVAADNSGQGNVGAIEGNPAWALDPDRGGMVLVFDGIDDRVNFGPLFTFRNNSWSISVRVKTPPNNASIPLIGKNQSDGAFSAGERDIEITGTGTWGNLIDPEPAGNLAINGYSMNGAVTNQSVVVLDDDTWHMVTIVHDNSVGDTHTALYIDGLPQPQGSSTFNNNNQADVGKVYLGFANASGSGSTSPEGYFAGRMSDLRLYQRVVTPEEVIEMREAPLVPEKAWGPSPLNGAADVRRDDVVLRWRPGKDAAQHDIYIGEDFNDVSNATTASDAYRNRGDTTTFELGRLDFGMTYYWRIDEAAAPPASTIVKGDVWSFATEPVGYPVAGQSIKTTASSSEPNQGPENTINGSGLANDLHSEGLSAMWLTAGDANGPARILYEFDRVLRLDRMWVWNHNGLLERVLGLGAKEVVVEYSTNGADFTVLGTTHEFTRAPGRAGYACNTTVDLQGIAAKYVKLTINSNWGNILKQYGLSEVRFFSVPVFAREPSPIFGAANVDVDASVSWRAGREAARHNVYLSTDQQAVTDGTAAVQTVASGSYTPTLDLAGTYYWRVDEANEAETPSTWQGDVWSFSTQKYVVVDDFESYTNDSPNRVFQAWIDGAGFSPDDFFPQGNPGNGSGALVGYDPLVGQIMETTTIHAGKKSMPLTYDNTTMTNSEIKRTFSSPQDWTQHGVKALTLWFYGDPTNVAQQMYVKINNTKVPYDGAADNLKRKQWQMWYVPLASLNVSSVTSLSIGFDRVGTVGGTGKVLIDDIRLYSYDRQLVTPKDPGTAGLQAQYQFEGNVNDSSGKARNGTLVGAPTYMEGKFGQAISLDGFDDYVNIDGYKGVLADAAGVQQPVTVCAWVKTTVDGDIVSWGTNAGGQRMCFRVDTVIRVEHGSGNIRGTNGPSLRDDEWHHVAATVPQAGRMMDVRLYTDGGDATPTSTTTAAFNIKANIDVRIGMGGPTGGRFLKALIDDVRIYDRVLSAEEIARLAGRTIPFDKGF